MPGKAQIIDGSTIAKKIREELTEEFKSLIHKSGAVPTLAVVLVGDDEASKIYIKHKKAGCAEVGIKSVEMVLSKDTTESELVDVIKELNNNPMINGILVQVPLPAQINPKVIAEVINPQKDVDGFHPYNIGSLAKGRPSFRSCTPYGIMLLLESTKVNLVGKTAVVVGTSDIVGIPMLLELISAGVTVTACNIDTPPTVLQAKVEEADIVITATGIAGLIKGEWIKDGSIVIDCGSPRAEVEFEIAVQRAAWITPVPKGVGPMTIACLLTNVLQACSRQLNLSLES